MLLTSRIKSDVSYLTIKNEIQVDMIRLIIFMTVLNHKNDTHSADVHVE